MICVRGAALVSIETAEIFQSALYSIDAQVFRDIKLLLFADIIQPWHQCQFFVFLQFRKVKLQIYAEIIPFHCEIVIQVVSDGFPFTFHEFYLSELKWVGVNDRVDDVNRDRHGFALFFYSS